MTDHVGELDYGDSGFELFDDKGMAKIVDFRAFDASNAEVTIDGSADVANEERIAGFSNKKGGIFSFGTTGDIFFNSSFRGVI